MKSKTFCFNPAVFRKNTVLYWPLWAGYLIALLAMLPIRLWMDFNSYISYYVASVPEQEKRSMLMYYFRETMSRTDVYSMVVFVMAVLTMMALFNYLFTARNTNMMHAFPVTRGELFGTSVVNALCFMLIPELIAFFATVLVCLSYGVTCVQYVAIFYLFVATASVLFLALSAVAAMLTGQLLGLPVIAVVLNMMYVWIRIVIGKVLCLIGYGLTEYTTRADHGLLFFSPISYFMRRVKFTPQYTQGDNMQYMTGITPEGFQMMGWYLLAAIVFFVAAEALYRKRPLEKAGDVVIFSALNPFFRWLMGGMAGYTLVMYACMFLEEARIFLSRVVMVGIVILAGLLAFYLAEMLIRKNFRVLNKKILRESVIFAGAMLASFGVVMGVAKIQENYVPKQEMVDSVEFALSYQMALDEEAVGDVLALQQEILAHADEWNSASKKTVDYTMVRFSYKLKNGSSVRRSYLIPYTESGLAMLAKLTSYERTPKRFEKYYLSDYYNNRYYASGGFDLNYSHYIPFGDDTAQVLLDAIQQDVEEGNIQDYNLIHADGSWDSPEDQYSGYVNFGFEIPNKTTQYDEYLDEYIQAGDYCSISFGKKCRNLIDALVETGLINSEDDLILLKEQDAEVVGSIN